MVPHEAIDAAKRYLALTSEGRDFNFILLEDLTKTIKHGWVFFSNTDRYLATEDIEWDCPYPFIVDSDSFAIYEVGTAEQLDYYIREFEHSKAAPKKTP